MKKILKKKKVLICMGCVLIVIVSVIGFLIFKKSCPNCTPCSLAISCECNKKTCDCIYMDENNEIQKVKCRNMNKE